MKKVVFVLSLLFIGMLHATQLVNFLYINRLAIAIGSGRFYGSQSTPLPDDALSQCLELCAEAQRPFTVVWGKSESTLSSFVSALNASYATYSSWGVSKKVLQGLFYGTARQAESDVADFVLKHHGDPGNSPVCVCYAKFPDGYELVSSGTFSSPAGYQGIVNIFVTRFNAELPKHHFIPPASDAKFAVEDGELKVAAETETIYVPFIRTNSLDKAETNWLEVIYPGGEISTNEFEWVQGGEYLDVKLELAGKLTNVNDKATLVLLNTNHLAVATNSITCVA